MLNTQNSPQRGGSHRGLICDILSVSNSFIKFPFSEAALKRNVMRVDCETEMKKYLSYLADRLTRKRQREQAGE